MVLVIGEVLVDIFPKYIRLGGAPFNFAYHLKHFGYPVRFISRIGIDHNGKRLLERITKAGFNADDIQIDEAHPTGTVQVKLDEMGVPDFNILPDVAYDYIDFVPEIHSTLLENSSLLYFGTLVQRTDHGFRRIQQFLHGKPADCISLYDINLRPDCYSVDAIQASLLNTDVLKLNRDELQECKAIAGNGRDTPAFVRHMMAKYDLDRVAVTKGGNGSDLYTKDEFIHAAPVPVASMVDTVGAGDAYAAMLAAGILEKWPPPKTLSMAAEFASRLCAIEGAIPESPDFYAPVLTQMRNGE
ncbi:hypothetical protein D3OALGA1CA_5523 [Olavius algarvensis associated proteobacterium Delta 3]|nr:hypothetical protein D3OALGB2SA_1367 [Olavius algarvensis associated proteobacterium Delta 3]CAB5167917.1 hypothetical protein D3OALGA1CA_5523 [Olavius algarvensis associated proteobacterium Delta 3]